MKKRSFLACFNAKKAICKNKQNLKEVKVSLYLIMRDCRKLRYFLAGYKAAA